MTSFSEAVSRREPGVVLDTRTGEMFDPHEAGHEDLVDIFIGLQNAEKQFKEWRTAIEDELVRRHGDRRAAQVVGNHEIDVERGMTRKWDAEELIGAVSHLVGEGLLTVMDAQGLVRDEPKVDGVKAMKLLNRLEKTADQLNREDDEALVELRKCFVWKPAARARVKVTPVAELEA